MTAQSILKKRDSLSRLSTFSGDTEIPKMPVDEHFTPVKALNIHARGIRLIRLPVPNFELTVPIYDTTGKLCYISQRNKVRSGDAVLVGIEGYERSGLNSEQWEEDGESGRGVPLVETKYFFGPGRDPVIGILHQDELTNEQLSQQSFEEKRSALSIRSGTASTLVPSKGLSFKFASAWTSRTCTFTVPDTDHTFSWRHEQTVLPSGEKAKLLSLYWHISSSKGNSQSAEKIKVAQLVRSASTRTPGTRPSTAGNGGRLELGRHVKCVQDRPMLAPGTVHNLSENDEGGLETVIDEALIVATCLSMMKKEGDRRRGLQFMMLAAMSSGGS